MEEEKVGRGSQTVEGPRPRWGETERKVNERERRVKESASRRTQGVFCLCLLLSKGQEGTKEIGPILSSSSSNSSSPSFCSPPFFSFCTHREIAKDEKEVIGSTYCARDTNWPSSGCSSRSETASRFNLPSRNFHHRDTTKGIGEKIVLESALKMR